MVAGTRAVTVAVLYWTYGILFADANTRVVRLTPADDDEAIARILDAARHRIDRSGKDFGISDVAKDVGVTRQTVYRYFPSTEALLFATSVAEVGPFLDSLAAHLRRIHDPAEAVVEGIAHTLERLPHERYLSLLLTLARPAHSRPASPPTLP